MWEEGGEMESAAVGQVAQCVKWAQNSYGALQLRIVSSFLHNFVLSTRFIRAYRVESHGGRAVGCQEEVGEEGGEMESAAVGQVAAREAITEGRIR